MKKITLEKTHALLEKLAEYVMTEVAKKSELNELKTEVTGLKTDVNGLKTDVNGLKIDVDGLKTEFHDLKSDMNQKLDFIITGQDKQAKQIEDLKIEQIATNATLMRHEKRITHLER